MKITPRTFAWLVLLLFIAVCCPGCGAEQPMFKASGQPRFRLTVKQAKIAPFANSEPLLVPADPAGKKYPEVQLYVAQDAILTSADIAGTSAVASEHAEYGWQVKIFLTKAAKLQLAALTTKHEGLWLVIYLDDQYEMAALVHEPITEGIAVLSSKFTEAEAMNLAKGLVGP